MPSIDNSAINSTNGEKVISSKGIIKKLSDKSNRVNYGSQKSLNFLEGTFPITYEVPKHVEDDDTTIKYGDVKSTHNFHSDSSMDSPDIVLENKKITNNKIVLKPKDSNYPDTSDLESKTPQILIVDDVSFCRNQVENMINKILLEKKKNIKIIHEDDGLGTINRVMNDRTSNSNLIKLIISDENMSFINGSHSFNTLQMLENKGAIKKIKKVILTALEDENSLKFLKSVSNADAIYKKPIHKSLMLELMNGLDL